MAKKLILELLLIEFLINYSYSAINIPFTTYKYISEPSIQTKTTDEIFRLAGRAELGTDIKVGTPSQKLRMNIEMHTPYLAIISKKFSDHSSNIPFSTGSSSTYKYINENETVYLDRIITNDGWEGKYDADISEENFIIGNKEVNQLRFFLVKENYHSEIFQINSGVIGLDLNRNTKVNAYYYHFFSRFKASVDFKGNEFYLKFNNQNEGSLTIGEKVNQTNKDLNKYYFNLVYADFTTMTNGLRWGLTFEELNVTSDYHKVQYSNRYSLRFTFSTANNSLVLVKNLYDNCFEDFLMEYINRGYCQKEEIYNGYFFGFSCINDKNLVDFKRFPKLRFYHQELNDTFEFTFDDLKEVVGNRVYYLVYFYSQSIMADVRNVLGIPFFRKYGSRMYFDYDKHQIGYFSTKLNITNTNTGKTSTGAKVAITIVIIILVLLILGLLFFIYRKRKLLSLRKKRASELEDEFLYLPKLPD